MNPQLLKSLEDIHLAPFKALSHPLQQLIKAKLWVQIMAGLALGIATGILLGPDAGLVSEPIALLVGHWLALPGQLFLAMIQMIVIPLVFASVIHGLAAVDNVEQLKRLGLRTVLFFLITTIGSSALGVVIALLIKPGRFVSVDTIEQPTEAPDIATLPSSEPMDLMEVIQVPGQLLDILPQNPMLALTEGQMLQIVVFAVVVGVALVSMPVKDSKPLLDMLSSVQHVCMTVVRWAMVLAPLAVFGLIAQLTSQVGLNVLLGLMVYIATVLLGLLCILLVYFVINWVVSGISPIRFLAATKEVLLLAFSTSSSAAVMPLSIKTAEEKLNVRSSISEFVVPFGATINMNGSALYYMITTLFLAQVFQLDLNISALILLVVTAVSASIGAPGAPGVGIVILAMMLETVGIPTQGVALIIGVNRILDMSLTVINVSGDLTACLVMDRFDKSPGNAAVYPREKTACVR
jgi:Na+/H+-dicarboxylate symporter